MKKGIVDPRDLDFFAKVQELRSSDSREYASSLSTKVCTKEERIARSQKSSSLSGAPSQGTSSRSTATDIFLKGGLVTLGIAALVLLGSLLKKKFPRDKDGR